jgi:hypothetical protein
MYTVVVRERGQANQTTVSGSWGLECLFLGPRPPHIRRRPLRLGRAAGGVVNSGPRMKSPAVDRAHPISRDSSITAASSRYPSCPG